MRFLALTLIALVLARSVLDPEAGITLLQGLLLMALGVVAVNVIFPRRGMSIWPLVVMHLLGRRNRRKEYRHAKAHPTDLRQGSRAARRTHHESGRKAA
ncbi:MAG TPA: hypothetical protein PLV77_06885 [Solirubrobacterales bacterium]|nr:hypothetical protein [Solirubrobacterales bacterium]